MFKNCYDNADGPKKIEKTKPGSLSITHLGVFFKTAVKVTAIWFRRSSHSPESGVGSHTSHTSLPDSEVERLYANAEAEIGADEDDTLNGDGFENELLPVLGTCRALYAFEGSFPCSFSPFFLFFFLKKITDEILFEFGMFEQRKVKDPFRFTKGKRCR